MQEFQWNLLELNLETNGLCESRPLPFSEDQKARDVAYDLSSTDEVINTTAGSLFPSGIPEEFVVFATVKVQPDNTADLFTISDGDQSLSFSLNPIEFEYRRRGAAPVRAGVQESIADGAWHRIAFAVRRKHLALSLDCAKPKTRVRRPRGFKPSFSQNSNVRIGGQFKVRGLRVFIFRFFEELAVCIAGKKEGLTRIMKGSNKHDSFAFAVLSVLREARDSS